MIYDSTILFLYACKCTFVGRCTTRLCRRVPGEKGWIQVLGGLTLSIQTVVFWLRTPDQQSQPDKIIYFETYIIYHWIHHVLFLIPAQHNLAIICEEFCVGYCTSAGLSRFLWIQAPVMLVRIRLCRKGETKGRNTLDFKSRRVVDELENVL